MASEGQSGARGTGANGLALAVGLAMAGAGLGLATLSRRRRGLISPEEQRRAALVAYLHDHLGGAEVAMQVVDRLRRTSAAPQERQFFGWLHHELARDHDVVVSVLESLGASRRSTKRLTGQASGGILKFLAGGRRGELALFRTFEALAIGVQGKRCLWRALQALTPALVVPGVPSWTALEAAAQQQWEAIEGRRRALVPQTFATHPFG
jgi:hypothetical protein